MEAVGLSLAVIAEVRTTVRSIQERSEGQNNEPALFANVAAASTFTLRLADSILSIFERNPNALPQEIQHVFNGTLKSVLEHLHQIDSRLEKIGTSRGSGSSSRAYRPATFKAKRFINSKELIEMRKDVEDDGRRLQHILALVCTSLKVDQNAEELVLRLAMDSNDPSGVKKLGFQEMRTRIAGIAAGSKQPKNENQSADGGDFRSEISHGTTKDASNQNKANSSSFLSPVDYVRVGKDFIQSIKKDNHAQSMTKLADVLMTGAVFKPDAAQAVQLYSRAVREGADIDAMIKLAALFEKGSVGVRAQPEQALYLYTRAMEEGGNLAAMTSLAALLEAGAEGVEADPGRSVQIYKRAIEEGKCYAAMNNLALILQNGAVGVRADPVHAVQLFSRAIEDGGSVDAMNNLANILATGAEGVPADPVRAAKLYAQAIDQGGHVDAMMHLASMLKTGADGVNADTARSVELYSRAIEYGGHNITKKILDGLLTETATSLNADPVPHTHSMDHVVVLSDAPERSISNRAVPDESFACLVSLLDSESPNPLSEYEIFSSFKDHVPRSFLERLDKLYLVRDEILSDIDSGSEMRRMHNDACGAWELVFNRVRQNQSSISSKKNSNSGWQSTTVHERLEFRERGTGSCIVFLKDFVLAYDSGMDLLGFFCPLSGFIEVRRTDICFDDLINDVNEAQVHFIARRMVQLTGLSWDWDCLAKFEKDLPESECLSTFTDLLSGHSVDLQCSSLENIVGFKIGLIEETKGPNAYKVGLQADQTIFGLKPTHNGAMYQPEKLVSAHLIDSDEDIDSLCITVGGLHDLTKFARGCFPKRNEDQQKDCRQLQNFNLAYIPRHLKYKEAIECKKFKRKKFTRAKPIREAFIALGYGEQMSKCLASKGMHMLVGDTKRVSLLSIQRSLLVSWRNLSDDTMIPLTFRKRIRKNKDVFLALSGRKVIIARSEHNLSKSVTFGLNVNFASASFASQRTSKAIMTETEVFSVYDAIGHLTGKHLNFSKQGLPGREWYEPTVDGMTDITGALAFLHVILAGKVNPCGIFKSAVPLSNLSNISELQSVRIDLPVPYGIDYSSHAMGFEPKDNAPTLPSPNFFPVREMRWDTSQDVASFPALVGGPDDDFDVREACFSTASGIASN